jgi:hypothetical protein
VKIFTVSGLLRGERRSLTRKMPTDVSVVTSEAYKDV